MKKEKGTRLEKITFQRLLTGTMVLFVSIIFFGFSLIVTSLSETKLRQIARDNMSIVMQQFDVYLGNYIANIFTGFKSFESSPQLFQLREKSYHYKRRHYYMAGNYIYLKKQMDQFLAANSASVRNVYINFGNGHVNTQAYTQDLLKINYSYDVWKERFPENRYYWVLADSCRDLVPDPEVGAVLFHLYDELENSQEGIILITIGKSFFENILDVSELHQKSSLNIVTEEGILEFGDPDSGAAVAEHQEYLMGKGLQTAMEHENLDGYHYMYDDISPTGWKLVYCVEKKSMSNAHYIVRDVMMICAFTILAASLFLGMISRAISYSLKTLTEKVAAEDMLEHEISLRSYAEITTLSNSLEMMRRHINQLLGQVKKEQEEKRRTEVALLQEQINPHFLYNTLYSIMQLCELKETERATKMIEALSSFYRIGLNRGENIITVKEELTHVRNYLYIQHFRYSDLFDYSIDCEEELLECRIPKMSLQPLVENAIYHGIKKKHGFGNICVLGGSYDGEYAYLEVHDDGPGIGKERLEEIKKSLDTAKKDGCGVGLSNVNSRIRYEFGAGSGVEIEVTPQDTCVRIRFAMSKTEQSEEE